MDGWRKVRSVSNVLSFGAVVILFIALLMLISILTPFHPMTVSNIRLKPEKVCPLELVEVYGNTTLDDGRYSITIDPIWIKLDDDRKTLDEAQVDGYAEGPARDIDASEELVYVSPPEIGTWTINFEVHVEGRNIILPRHQHLELKSENTVEVVDCGDNYTYDEYSKRN